MAIKSENAEQNIILILEGEYTFLKNSPGKME